MHISERRTAISTPEDTCFERHLRPHLDYLYQLAFRFTGSADHADDLVQDVVIKLYPRCQQQLSALDQPRPWLARVLYRQFIDNTRKYTRSPVRLALDLGGSDDAGLDLDAVPDLGLDPEASAEQNYRQQVLEKAWQQLNAEHRTLLALHDIEGYTLLELTTVLETPIGTLKSRLHRARNRLRGLLAGQTF